MRVFLISAVLAGFLVGFSSVNTTTITDDDGSQTNIVISGQLAEKEEDESMVDYCIRYFARMPFEDEKLYVARVFHKYENEDENSYLIRVRTVLETFNNFNGWYNIKYLDLTKQYFTLEYQQKEGESRDSYYKRIFSKQSDESFDLYRNRIKVLTKLFPILEYWQSGKEDQPTRNGKPSEGKTERSVPGADTNNTSDSDTATQLDQTETNAQSYSAAEVESETTMDSIVQSEQGTSQTENESDKSVAVTAEGNANVLEEKKYGETEERYCKRVFSQRYGEDEKSYVRRVFNKYDDETYEQYVHRIDVVISVVQSQCFYNFSYTMYTQYYMSVKYQRQVNESESTYFRRILTKKRQESFQIYTARIGFLRKFIPGLSCWNRFRFDRFSSRGYTLRNRKSANMYYPHVMRKW